MVFKLQSEWAISQRPGCMHVPARENKSPEGEVEIEVPVTADEDGTMISIEAATETAVAQTDVQESIQYQTKVALIGK